MDFFAEIDHISIKIWICGEESKFNVITKFGGKSPHQFWEITKNRCLGPGRFWMHVCPPGNWYQPLQTMISCNFENRFSPKFVFASSMTFPKGDPFFFSNRKVRFREIFRFGSKFGRKRYPDRNSRWSFRKDQDHCISRVVAEIFSLNSLIVFDIVYLTPVHTFIKIYLRIIEKYEGRRFETVGFFEMPTLPKVNQWISSLRSITFQ